MCTNLLRDAEFLLRIQEERKVDNLLPLLRGAAPDRALPILRRIGEILGDTDSDIYLSLAILSFHQGQDHDAVQYLAKAKSIDPIGHKVLRVALFLSAAMGRDDAEAICRELLSRYPDDEWAERIRKELDTSDSMPSVSLPPLDTRGERIMCGENPKREVS